VTEGIRRTILQSRLSRNAFSSVQALFYQPGDESWPELKTNYEKDGLVILPKYFSEDLCNAVLLDIDKAVEKTRCGSLNQSIRTIDNDQVYANGERVIYSFDFGEFNEKVNRIVQNPQLRSICEYINQSKLKVIQHWTKRVIPSSKTIERRLMNESWHRDGGGLSLVRFIVNLNDVRHDQGPFQFARGSHRRSVSRESCYTGEADIVSCEGRKGDVIIVNVTGGWHRAGKVTNGQRDTLQVALCSPWADGINRFLKYGSYLK